MKFLVLFLLLLVSQLSQAQHRPLRKRVPGKKLSVSFPHSFTGHWQGTLYWYQTGKTTPQTVNMELHVLPADTAGQYTWQIVYGKATEDNRPYVLKPIDTAKGHWQIDEKNGILLDCFWVGERFTGAFSVSGNTILDAYWIENNALHLEFFSYKQNPVTNSGKGTDDSPLVSAYRIGSYQKAVLYRMAAEIKK